MLVFLSVGFVFCLIIPAYDAVGIEVLFTWLTAMSGTTPLVLINMNIRA